VAAIIPALDEEQTLGGVIAGLDRDLVRDVIVGDNGSRDRTAEVARAHGATVVHVPQRGYGAACAGALATLADDVELVVFLDADGADDPADLPALLAPLLRGEADLVIGSRVARAAPGALTPPQRVGNAVATGLIRLLFRFRYTDLGPFRAVRRELLERAGMRDRGYGWTVELQVRALRLGARVAEIPVAYRRRAAGRSKVSGTLAGSLKAGYWILATIARHAWR
jgi:glycosyltransferase involved in cell wall biosynthesis